MKSQSVKRRMVWWRIWLGFLGVVLVAAVPGMVWLFTSGESYFSLTRRLPAEVLVVEGWIGLEGLRSAAAEFKERGYRYIVATGGQIADRADRSTYAEMAGQELFRLGIPKDKIIAAPIGQIERERTYKSAVAAWQALQEKGIHPEALNVFTLGPHARRSRLVYAKIYRPGTQVGVIAFVPSSYEAEPWWRSGARTKCMLKEIVGYPFEILLNSGRGAGSPG